MRWFFWIPNTITDTLALVLADTVSEIPSNYQAASSEQHLFFVFFS